MMLMVRRKGSWGSERVAEPRALASRGFFIMVFYYRMIEIPGLPCLAAFLYHGWTCQGPPKAAEGLALTGPGPMVLTCFLGRAIEFLTFLYFCLIIN